MDGLWKQKMAVQMEEDKRMEITLEELALYDGKGGRPAYVAVNNVVYNVTDILAWAGGMHYGSLAGTDATMDFEMCHKETILENLIIVGKLVE